MIGFFGLTANPPHKNHLKVILEAAKTCDEVWVSLVYLHPFGKEFIDYQIRNEMFEIIIDDFIFNKTNHEFSQKEKDLFIQKVKIKNIDKEFHDKYKEIPYSYHLLKELKNRYPESDYKLIIGEDNYQPETWEKFKFNKEIDIEFGVISIEDKGIHSSFLRENIDKILCADQEIDNQYKNMVLEFLGNKLFSFIMNQRLYYEDKDMVECSHDSASVRCKY